MRVSFKGSFLFQFNNTKTRNYAAELYQNDINDKIRYKVIKSSEQPIVVRVNENDMLLLTGKEAKDVHDVMNMTSDKINFKNLRNNIFLAYAKKALKLDYTNCDF